MNYEFKGTKGKWVESDYPAERYTKKLYNKVVLSGEESHEVANCCGRTTQKAEANAKLISKAPELFEMVKKLIDKLDEYAQSFGYDESKLIGEAKQLLKQATES